MNSRLTVSTRIRFERCMHLTSQMQIRTCRMQLDREFASPNIQSRGSKSTLNTTQLHPSDATIIILVQPETLARVLGLRSNTARIAGKPRRLTDIGKTQKQHHDTLKTDTTSTMRKRSIAERIDVIFDRF